MITCDRLAALFVVRCREYAHFIGIVVLGSVFFGVFLSCEKLSDTPTLTVTFDVQGGSAVPLQTVDKGQKATKPADPTRTGYEFVGWHRDVGGSRIFNFAVDIITANITLYARWLDSSKPVFTVMFDVQGGSAVPSQTVDKGQKATKPADPTRKGYEFVGWHRDVGGSRIFNFAVDIITANITLYARWLDSSKPVFTVMFDVQGGSAVPLQTVDKGQKATKPVDPTRTGYEFVGWHRDVGGSRIFNFAVDIITANITLYARWLDSSKPAFTVMFDVQGGSAVPLQTVNKGQKATKPADPTRTGYEFVGWYRDSPGSRIFNFAVDTITLSITLYAGWGVVIPDANFRAQLKAKVPGAFLGDLLIPRRRDVTTLTSLYVSGTLETPDGERIASLSGIEHFTSLILLDCHYNKLTELDVSKNISLEKLYCYYNKLTELDVSKNTSLTRLVCEDNNITVLNVSGATALTYLDCHYNKLTELDVSKNVLLTSIGCSHNSLTTLDVSKNTLLTTLVCISNSLTELDMSKNMVLMALSCGTNRLTELDMSSNTVLKTLYCRFNKLTKLDLRGMREILGLFIGAGNQLNPITELKVHNALKDHAEIREAKTKLGSKITIRTYSANAGSSFYTPMCNDYDPSGAGSCTQEP